MNPAALKVNLADLEEGGTLIINTDGFTAENLKYANYASNPLEDGSLAGYRVHKLPITTLNMNALKGNVELSRKEIDRSKNFFALGVLYWLYDRPMDGTLAWITSKFGKNPELANELLQVLVSPDYQKQFAAQGTIPALKSLLPTISGSDAATAQAKAAENSRFTPSSENWAAVEASNILPDMIVAISGGADVKAEAAKADAAIEGLLNG